MWQALETNPGDLNDVRAVPMKGSQLHSVGTTVGVVDGHIEYVKTAKFYAWVPCRSKRVGASSDGEWPLNGLKFACSHETNFQS